MDLLTTVTMVLACSLYPDHSITNAMIEVGSKNNPLTITVGENKNNNFKTPEEASAYALSQIQQDKTADIGLMQIPSFWLKPFQTTPAELVYSCKNVVVATKILNEAEAKCTQMSDSSNDDVKACTLSLYKTGDSKAGLDYAHAIIDYANHHPFAAMAAAAEAKNPRGFHMIPGDVPTTATTANATKINPVTDKIRKSAEIEAAEYEDQT